MQSSKIYLVIIFTFLGVLFAKTNAQSADSLSEEIQKEYYYCFAMFMDTVFYTQVLEFSNTEKVSKMLYVEENWINHVHQEMNREHFITIVNGPYAKQEYAQDEQDNWKTVFNDTINLINLKYSFE